MHASFVSNCETLLLFFSCIMHICSLDQPSNSATNNYPNYVLSARRLHALVPCFLLPTFRLTIPLSAYCGSGKKSAHDNACSSILLLHYLLERRQHDLLSSRSFCCMLFVTLLDLTQAQIFFVYFYVFCYKNTIYYVYMCVYV